MLSIRRPGLNSLLGLLATCQLLATCLLLVAGLQYNEANMCTLQIFKELQVNYRKMMVDVTRKTYYLLVAHQRIVGFSCYSYMKLAGMYRNLLLSLPSNYKSTIGSVQNASVTTSKIFAV